MLILKQVENKMFFGGDWGSDPGIKPHLKFDHW